MAVSSAPSLNDSGRAMREISLSTHRGHALQYVGPINCASPKGTADVWYCQTDHQLIVDRVS